MGAVSYKKLLMRTNATEPDGCHICPACDSERRVEQGDIFVCYILDKAHRIARNKNCRLGHRWKDADTAVEGLLDEQDREWEERISP